jgi:tripartite-type tricarboxylate transporter receptor subunit TctC
VIAKLNAAVVHALADPIVRARFAQSGQDTFPREQQTPQFLGAYHKAEVEKWGAVIKATGVKVQ